MVRRTNGGYERIAAFATGALAFAGCVAAPAPEEAAIEAAALEVGLPDPLAAGWKGQAVCEALEDNAHLRVLRCTFPPGVGHEAHVHAPHFGYALKGGEARIEDARGTREATTPDGYSWWTGETTSHANQNVGSETSVYLIVEPKSAAGGR